MLGEAIADSSLIGDVMRTDKYRAQAPEHQLNAACDTPHTLDHPISLFDSVTLALCNNPQTHATWIGALASADAYGVQKTSYLPTISVDGGTTFTRTRTANERNTHRYSNGASLNLGYLLYDFGRREISIEQSRQALLAANFGYDSVLQGTIFATISVYFRYQAAVQTLQTAKDSHKYSDESLNAAQLRYKNGLAAYADVLQAKAALSQSELEITQAKNSVITTKGSLANVMGLPPDTDFSIDDYVRDKKQEKAFNISASDAIAAAKKARPDLAAVSMQVEQAKLELTSRRRENLPTVNLSAGRNYNNYGILNQRNAGSDSIGVSLSIPISLVGHKYNVASAEKSLEQERYTYEKAERDTELDAFNTWHAYDTALKSVTTSEEFLNSAQAVQKVSLGRYKEGVGAFIDVLNAQAQFTAAREHLIAAVYGVQISRADFIRAIGGLDTKAVHEMTEATP